MELPASNPPLADIPTSRRERAALVRYGAAFAAVGAALIVRIPLEPFLERRGVYTFMYLAVAVSGWFGGLGPGLVAVLTGGLLADYFYIEPRYTWAPHSVNAWVQLAIYSTIAALIVVLCESLRRAQHRTEEALFRLERLHALHRSQSERMIAVEQDARRSADEARALADAARREAEQANRAKDDFLATVSHELRTPLHSILGWTSLLSRDDGANPVRLREGLAVIERNARAQATLIEDILDVSRMIAGNLRLELRPTLVADVIADALETVRATALGKGVVFHVETRAVSPVMADAGRLRQVFWNLLSNAVKFTPDGGVVAVTTTEGESGVRVAVADTGAGIAAEFLPYVFERFRQADGSTTRRFSGLGLGLAIVRLLVEAHGGSVIAESDGPGRGATFIVELPIAPGAGVAATASESGDAGPPAPGPVLYSPDNRR